LFVNCMAMNGISNITATVSRMTKSLLFFMGSIFFFLNNRNCVLANLFFVVYIFPLYLGSKSTIHSMPNLSLNMPK
jgi:hypothetical protein